MKTILLLAQILISVFLITVVMMQSKGGGLGSAFGGGSMAFHSRRGVEKLLHYVTIFLVAGFAVVSIVNVILG